MPINRPRLIAMLRRTLHDDPAVIAAGEGGSAAFGRDDELPHIDAVAVVADDAVDGTFARVEAALDALSPIELRVVMPPAGSHAQRFCRLRDAGEFLVVDLVLMRPGDPLLVREEEIDGCGWTWFDREGILAAAHDEAELWFAGCIGRLERLGPAAGIA